METVPRLIDVIDAWSRALGADVVSDECAWAWTPRNGI